MKRRSEAEGKWYLDKTHTLLSGELKREREEEEEPSREHKKSKLED